MDHPVAAQCPLRGEREVEAILAYIKHPFPFLLPVQPVGDDADHAASVAQTSLLRGAIRATGVSGDQGEPPLRRPNANGFRESMVLR